MAWRLNNVTSNVYIPFHETPNFKIFYPPPPAQPVEPVGATFET